MGTSGAAVWVETPLALGLAVTASVSGLVDGLVDLFVDEVGWWGGGTLFPVRRDSFTYFPYYSTAVQHRPSGLPASHPGALSTHFTHHYCMSIWSSRHPNNNNTHMHTHTRTRHWT